MALKRCETCGGPLKRVLLREYRDPRLGLPGVVVLDAVEELRCAKCRTVAGIGFPNLPGLFAAAAVARILNPTKLSGEELRSLRRALDMTGKQLAAALGVRLETVSRWENNKEPMGPTSEKLLRILAGLALGAQAHLIPFDTAAIVDMELTARPSRKPVEIRLRLVRVAGVKIGRPGVWEQAKKAA